MEVFTNAQTFASAFIAVLLIIIYHYAVAKINFKGK